MSNGAKEPISQCQAKVAAADIKINDVVRPISSRQLEPQRDLFSRHFRKTFERVYHNFEKYTINSLGEQDKVNYAVSEREDRVTDVAIIKG